MKTDWTRIENWAGIFKHPLKLTVKVAENIVKHFKEIAADVTEIKADESSGNYEDMGKAVA